MERGRVDELVSSLKDNFAKEYSEERIMSFSDYLAVFLENPQRQMRNAVQYVRDSILHYGVNEGTRPWGEYTRYTIFDGVGEDCRKVVGMEQVQHDFFESLDVLAKQGRTDKIVVLHGPPGSGKSTFFETLLAGMESYSKTDEGALYRFAWIFPSDANSDGKSRSIGFGSDSKFQSMETYAHLNPDDIEARIPGEMSDHPLLLLPRPVRREIIDSVKEDGDGCHLLESELNPTNKEILDALLLAYEGDYDKVLRHVQIQRFHISRRYRRSAVFIEPQLHVDAKIQQVTMDESYKAIPSDLRHLDLHRPKGDLVEANRGVVVFEDIFKRPAEMNRYLLGTAEKGRVTVEDKILQLDELMVATANEIQLMEWSQTKDSLSMRGRVELIRVPYLLDYKLEQEMYDQFLGDVSLNTHLAPDTVKFASFWTVLTRMHPFPDEVDDIPDRVAVVMMDMDPVEKLELYSEGKPPSWVSSERGQEVRSLVPEVMEATIKDRDREGMIGLSSRRMKMMILGAARSVDTCLTPMKLHEFLRDILDDPDLRPSFRSKPKGGYNDPDMLLEDARARYVEWTETNLLNALDFVEESNFDELFSRYVNHVRHHLRNEKLYNKITDTYDPPDQRLMREMEEMLEITEDPDEFRETIMSTIAAYSLENPDSDVEYRVVFPGHFDMFRKSVLRKQREPILNAYKNVITFMSEEGDQLSPSDKEEAASTVARLEENYGYCDDCMLEAVGLVVEKWEEELEEIG